MEYGDDSGPGILDLVGWVKGYRDVSGRTYIVGEPIDNVLVFDPDGRFLRRIGSSGSGPGELEDGSSLVVTGDGEFSVLDRGRGTILNFDHTGSLRSEVRTAGWVPHGTGTFAWDGPLAIHVADLATSDRIGFPLHLFNIETGEIDRSFGSVTGEHELGGNPGLHPIAVRQDRRIWMAVGFERYEIALWDMNRPHQLLQREASWFPEQTRDDLAHPGTGKPPRPFIYALALSDSDALLWVAASVAEVPRGTRTGSTISTSGGVRGRAKISRGARPSARWRRRGKTRERREGRRTPRALREVRARMNPLAALAAGSRPCVRQRTEQVPICPVTC